MKTSSTNDFINGTQLWKYIIFSQKTKTYKFLRLGLLDFRSKVNKKYITFLILHVDTHSSRLLSQNYVNVIIPHYLFWWEIHRLVLPLASFWTIMLNILLRVSINWNVSFLIINYNQWIRDLSFPTKTNGGQQCGH